MGILGVVVALAGVAVLVLIARWMTDSRRDGDGGADVPFAGGEDGGYGHSDSGGIDGSDAFDGGGDAAGGGDSGAGGDGGGDGGH